MSLNVQQIHELKDYLIAEYHSKRLAQQEEDRRVIDDISEITYLPEGTPVMRTGKAYRMVSSPAEHIITSIPQVFREVKGKGTEQNARVTSELNRWAMGMKRDNPQPFKEFIKKLLARGEAWIYILPSENNKRSIPFRFVIPEPMIVFVDGWAGEENGIPNRVIFCYERIAQDIKLNYPEWGWTKRSDRSWNSKVPYLLYIDNEQRYAEADSDSLFDGEIQENYYGFVPLVHAYAGFGESSPEGDPASLCISRITKARAKIAEHTAIKSVLNHLIFKYAQPPMDYVYDPQIFTPPPDLADNYDRSPGAFNTVPITPGGGLTKGVDMLPDTQLFAYLAQIEKEIDEEDPLGSLPQTIGSSGRQQDMAEQSALRRYDTVVENCSSAFSVAFGQALKMLEMRPSLLPEGIRKGDISKYYDCRVELKAEDPLERDRLATLGSRLYQQGQIDLWTNLTKYQKYTAEEADDIMARILADDATRNDPIIRTLMGQQIAKRAGLEQEYEGMKQMFQATQGLGNQQVQYGSQGGAPREGNIQTPMGNEMSDMSMVQRGQRRPPAA